MAKAKKEGKKKKSRKSVLRILKIIEKNNKLINKYKKNKIFEKNIKEIHNLK